MNHKTELKIEIISPEGVLFEGTGHQVTIPSSSGEMGILAEHEAVISRLSEGVVKVLNAKDKVLKEVSISGGFAEMFGNRLLVLVD